MTKRLKLTAFVSAIAALFLAVLFLFTGTGMLRANAAVADEDEPVHTPGWYIVGNGAGYLSKCSWTEYLKDYLLEGGETGSDNYEGFFTTGEILLYDGDQFKFLYNDGTWEYPSDSGWGADIQAQFSNILENDDANFADGGLGNILVRNSGYYEFTLAVSGGDIMITVEKSDKEAPDINLLEMYIVGSVASVPSCNWPSLVKDVATDCIKMTYNAVTNKWTATVYLIPTDQFKVYNNITGAYYPSGIDNNATGYEEGSYVIEWESNAPDFLVIPEAEYANA